jgi:hypothetical protein
MDDLELYSTIEYSPGWYYKKFPGFYNIECYKILSQYSHHPESFQSSQMEDGVEESKESEDLNKNAKRKRVESEECLMHLTQPVEAENSL